MKYSVKSSNPMTQGAACLAVTVFSDGSLGETATRVDEATGGTISAAVKRGDIKGKAGDTLLLPGNAELKYDRFLLLGAGEQGKLDLASAVRIGRAAVNSLSRSGAGDVAVALDGLEISGRSIADSVAVLVEAMEYAAYRFDQLKKQESTAGFRERPPHMETFFARGQAGVWRDDLTPAQVGRIREAFLPVLEKWYPEMLEETAEFAGAA